MKEVKNTTWKIKLESSRSLKSNIKSIFYTAKSQHLTHKEIRESLKLRVYEQSKYKTLPQYMRTEINGYIEANMDLMYDLLEWVHWYDGKFVGKDLPYGEGFKQNLINESSHVYKGTQDRY